MQSKVTYNTPPSYKCRNTNALKENLCRKGKIKMDGRGGCCLAGNGTGGGVYYHEVSKMDMDRIMMHKFRPIAPKPTISGSGSSGSSPEVLLKTARRKRRYVREANKDNNVISAKRRRGCSTGNERKKASSSTNCGEKKTLPCLLESDFKKQEINLPNHWINFSNRNVDHSLINKVMPESLKQTATTAAARVIVECMADTWVAWDGLGNSDEERITNLESDTCPVLVSNLLGLVTWTNEAMRKMLNLEGGCGGPAVSLLAREAIPDMAAFTCRVRLESIGRKGENKYMVVPCDAWRMDCGGYAWRLDVEAALRLGR